MPLTIDTGPRIYLEIQAKGNFGLHVLFTWNEIDMEHAFSFNTNKKNGNILCGESEVFTFDHNCDNITLIISDDQDHEIETFKLESFTVSRTYIVSGSYTQPNISTHEN
ncbi:MAG: hypothetical protein RR538_07985 [Erysipelotrichaceae bacterium]